MRRASPDAPILDPRTAHLTVTVTVHWIDPGLSSTGTAPASVPL